MLRVLLFWFMYCFSLTRNSVFLIFEILVDEKI